MGSGSLASAALRGRGDLPQDPPSSLPGTGTGLETPALSDVGDQELGNREHGSSKRSLEDTGR
eukprot:11016211-Prorocentrum_lima.AAC.1